MPTLSTLSTLIASLAVATLTSCSQGWTEKQKNNFIDRCMAAEAVNGRPEKRDREICNCLLGKMVSKYPDPKDTVNITYYERIEWGAKCMEPE